VDTIGLLAVGEKVEVAMPADFQYPPDFQYHSWQDVSISDHSVVHPVDMSAGIGLVVVQAAAPGLADLTADAKPGGSHFFRIEFVVRPQSSLADVAASDKDTGETVPVSVGQILSFSVPAGFPADWPERYESATRSRSILAPLDRPSVDFQGQTRYLLARAAGAQKLWWSSCPPTMPLMPLNPTCRPEVTLNVFPAGDLAAEATDSDSDSQFTLHPGQEIIVALHPYIGPWRGIAHSGGVIDLLSSQTIKGIQIWKFRAVNPGTVVLDASYACPAGEACATDTMIRVQVIAS
jgi:hypothetical protein